MKRKSSYTYLGLLLLAMFSLVRISVIAQELKIPAHSDPQVKAVLILLCLLKKYRPDKLKSLAAAIKI